MKFASFLVVATLCRFVVLSQSEVALRITDNFGNSCNPCNLHQQVTNLENSVSDLETNSSTSSGAISTLQTNVEALQNSSSTAATNITNLQAEVSSLQTAVSSLQTDVASLQTEVSSLQTAVANIPTISVHFTAWATQQTQQYSTVGLVKLTTPSCGTGCHVLTPECFIADSTNMNYLNAKILHALVIGTTDDYQVQCSFKVEGASAYLNARTSCICF